MVFNPSPCLSTEERRRAYGLYNVQLYYTNGDEILNTILYRGKLITYIQEDGAHCLISHTFKSSSSSLVAFVRNPAVLRAYTVEAQTTLTGFFFSPPKYTIETALKLKHHFCSKQFDALSPRLGPPKHLPHSPVTTH